MGGDLEYLRELERRYGAHATLLEVQIKEERRLYPPRHGRAPTCYTCDCPDCLRERADLQWEYRHER